MNQSILLDELHKNYQDYLEIVAQNPEQYILCIPPNQIVIEKCEVDPKFIQEHILEVLGENDYRSLAGKQFKTYDYELHLVDGTVYCSILSNDIYYTSLTINEVEKKNIGIKRYILSNCIDQRFFHEIKNQFLGSNDGGNS